MKPAHATEILLILLAAVGGTVCYITPQWWLRVLIGAGWFAMCSNLAGTLKRNAIEEYIEKLKTHNNGKVKV